VSFAAVTLCVASQRVFFVVVDDFVIDSFRILLDTPSYRLHVLETTKIVFASKSRFLFIHYYYNTL
jgi:hypothetical protein